MKKTLMLLLAVFALFTAPAAAQDVCGIYNVSPYPVQSNGTLSLSVTAYSDCYNPSTTIDLTLQVPSGAQQYNRGYGSAYATAQVTISTANQSGLASYWGIADTLDDCWEDSGESFPYGTYIRLDDLTPNVTGVSPNVLNAGSTTTVSITGTGFGANPDVSITDSAGAITKQILSVSNTQISMNVSVSASAPSESATITVVSRGFDGSGFVSQGGNPSHSPSISVQVIAIPRTIRITDTDLENNNVTVALNGPTGVSGTLTVVAHGSAHSITAVANGGGGVGPGTYNVSFSRPSIPVDTYSSLSASWNVQEASDQSLTLNRKWIVLGTIRHSQYNTVSESACTGTLQPAYVYDASCNWSQTQLRSDFMTQTTINGTGIRVSNGGILKYDSGLCNSNRPAGSTASNSYLMVNSVTGSCGSPLTGGDAVATFLGPRDSGTPYGCGDNMILVNSSNVRAFLKHVLDRCAGTAQGCADGHVDNYNGSPWCSGASIGDLPGSPYWTADTQ